MKKLTLLLLLTSIYNILSAQNPFKFSKVDYVGSMKTNDWTKNWTNWDPESTKYPEATEKATLNAGNGHIDISSNVLLDATKVYLLTGIIYVKDGGVLNIPEGTIIRGESNSATGNWATIVVQRGGKIMATGTESKPVVFTSNKDTRRPGDWGGIVILGRAKNNFIGGEGKIEGPFLSEGLHGGNKDDDNSGTISYTRIEFPGVVYSANNEINGLTLGSVGYNTELNHIQVSFSNDDSYEWFGGSVNSKYLVAFRGTDDDFDTDNGYSGMNQFGIGFKDSIHFDQTWNSISGASTSEGFESDNDATGSTNLPKTSAIFSNYTMIGPYSNGEIYTQHSSTVYGAYRRGARIRRNSSESIVNSIFIGYRNGIMLDGSLVFSNANISNGPSHSDDIYFRNNILFGMSSPNTPTSNGSIEVSNGGDTSIVHKWFRSPISSNVANPIKWGSTSLLVDPNNYTLPNLLPVSDNIIQMSDFSSYKLSNISTGTVTHLVNVVPKVYPNPCVGEVNIDLDLIRDTEISIQLCTLDGKIVKSIASDYKVGKYTIKIDGLSSGLYLLTLISVTELSIFKIIVE